MLTRLLRHVHGVAGRALAGFAPRPQNPARVAPTLLTIGYETHREPASPVVALLAADVERLVDVRELPLSRRRGFSKTALAGALADAGIHYEHERALGNPKHAGALVGQRLAEPVDRSGRPVGGHAWCSPRVRRRRRLERVG